MEWMVLPLKRYADFTGRSRRREFWMFTLLSVIVYAIGFALIFSSLPWSEIGQDASPGGNNTPPGPLFFVGFVFLAIWVLGTLIPNIALVVRRFHDQDMSGWFYLLTMIPYVGGIVLIVFMCIEGTRGPNRFGHDPKGRGQVDIFS